MDKGEAKASASKRDNPEFTQVTAYIRKATHKRVKLRMIEDDLPEFSELVEVLLREWAEGSLNVQLTAKDR